MCTLLTQYILNFNVLNRSEYGTGNNSVKDAHELQLSMLPYIF